MLTQTHSSQNVYLNKKSSEWQNSCSSLWIAASPPSTVNPSRKCTSPTICLTTHMWLTLACSNTLVYTWHWEETTIHWTSGFYEHVHTVEVCTDGCTSAVRKAMKHREKAVGPKSRTHTKVQQSYTTNSVFKQTRKRLNLVPDHPVHETAEWSQSQLRLR